MKDAKLPINTYQLFIQCMCKKIKFSAGAALCLAISLPKLQYSSTSFKRFCLTDGHTDRWTDTLFCRDAETHKNRVT